jgi:hypothetical protein
MTAAPAVAIVGQCFLSAFMRGPGRSRPSSSRGRSTRDTRRRTRPCRSCRPCLCRRGGSRTRLSARTRTARRRAVARGVEQLRARVEQDGLRLGVRVPANALGALVAIAVERRAVVDVRRRIPCTSRSLRSTVMPCAFFSTTSSAVPNFRPHVFSTPAKSSGVMRDSSNFASSFHDGNERATNVERSPARPSATSAPMITRSGLGPIPRVLAGGASAKSSSAPPISVDVGVGLRSISAFNVSTS